MTLYAIAVNDIAFTNQWSNSIVPCSNLYHHYWLQHHRQEVQNSILERVTNYIGAYTKLSKPL